METPSKVCLDRAVRLYLQQAPLEILLTELRASATAAGVSWSSLAFQEGVAAAVIGSPVAEEFPPRTNYTSRLIKVLLEGSELSGEEPAEALLLARMACVCGGTGAGQSGETAFESFWLPPGPSVSGNNGGRIHGKMSSVEGECAQFLSFRVSNRDNEVGLRIWEAARVLAGFCLAHSDLLKGRRVLELGAGTGMTGIVVAACCGAKEVVLTDYAPRVLANLRFNDEINRSKLALRPSSASTVTVRALDWNDYAATSLPPPETVGSERARVRVDLTDARASSFSGPGDGPESSPNVSNGNKQGTGMPPPVTTGMGHSPMKARRECGQGGDEGMEAWPGAGEDALGAPDVVLAADVVYDVRYHPALVGVVLETLRRCPDALIIFASTLRNAETMSGFHHFLEKAQVPFRNLEFPGFSADSITKAPKATDLYSLEESSTTYSSGRDSQIDGECRAEADDVVGDSPNTLRELRIQPDRETLIGDATLNVWSYPEEVERVRLCVCGRLAAPSEAAAAAAAAVDAR